ncbi:unnamed protein product [Parajaminaea phylloscopi]
MELCLATSEVDIFTYPGVATEDPATAPDPSKSVSNWRTSRPNEVSMLVVNVKLTVPSNVKPPERITSLAITIASQENMSFPSGYWEQNVPFYDKLQVEAAAGLTIQSGSVYHWDVPILIPCNVAPYERGRHARNYWRLNAKMTFPGVILKKSITSAKNLWVCSAPTDEAYNYGHLHSGFAEGLGQVQLSFVSRSFTVGGYLRGAILLPSPSKTLKIHAVNMTLIQTVTLHSRKKPDHVERIPDARYDFVSLKDSELASKVCHTRALCKPQPYLDEDGIMLEWIARLPSDHEARPTTLAGSDAHIKLSHSMELVILFDIDKDAPVRDANGNALRRRYRVTWPVTLVSCTLRWNSLVLPEYSAIDQCPVPERGRETYETKDEHADQSQCICGESLKDLVHHEDEAEANGLCTSVLMRQQLYTQNFPSMASSSVASQRRRQAAREARSRTRRPRRPDSNGAGPSNSNGRPPLSSHDSGSAGSSNVPSEASSVAPTPTRSRSRTPHGGSLTPRRNDPRSRSRAITPDRLSIDLDEQLNLDGPDDTASSAAYSGDEQHWTEEEDNAWDDEDDEELMNKLERERQKQEQLYTRRV